ncbi:MAG: Uma2 family endonuclease [candidate division WOR-3 bacterium]
MGNVVKEKAWTYEDYLKLDDDKRYEVIKGRLYEMPAPSLNHQRIILRLLKILLNTENLPGEIFVSPVDVVLGEETVVQPDIVLVLGESKATLKERIFGSPDLIIEVVSPSSYKRDRYEKFRIYEEHKVKEYWMVLPGEKVIEVWCLKEGKYVLHSIAVEKGEVESCVLRGLKVKVEEVFR